MAKNRHEFKTVSKVSRGETICPRRWQFESGARRSMVQPPSDGFIAVSAIFGGRTLTSRFNVQREVYFSVLSTTVAIAVNCVVFELGSETNRSTDGRTDGRIATLLNGPYRRAGA